ncbi:MAG: cytochrome P450 [Bauldia sp.]|nr:cytochrome P450 [Bauldia sp.]
MPSDSPVTPARIIPPAEQPAFLRYLRTVVRNPLEVWPEAIYRDKVHVERFLGRDALFVMDPDLIHQILVEEPEKYLKSEMMQRLLAPALGRGMVTSDGAQWRRQRRIVAPLFRPSEVARYVPQMLAAADREAVRLAALPEGAPVSLTFEMMRMTFDIIAETILAGADKFDVPALAEAINVYLSSTGWVVALAQLRLPPNFPRPGRKRFHEARDYLRRVTADLVAARRRGKSRPDLIQALIDARDEETGEAMTDVEIVDNLLTFIAAGHETTALALSWSFYLLSLDPVAERKVLAEAEAAGAPDRLTPEGVAGLGYTRQVISEALRLYPAAPALLRQPVEPVEIGGVKARPGTQIFIPIYAVHRHKALWDNPDGFDPDRFAPEAGKMRHRYQYLPFGGGPRICIGMGFALTEAAALLAKLLPRFRFEVTEEPVPVAQVTLRPRNGLPARLRHRRTTQTARAA